MLLRNRIFELCVLEKLYTINRKEKNKMQYPTHYFSPLNNNVLFFDGVYDVPFSFLGRDPYKTRI